MKKYILIFALSLCSISSFGQSKSDLEARVETLEQQVANLTEIVTRLQQGNTAVNPNVSSGSLAVKLPQGTERLDNPQPFKNDGVCYLKVLQTMTDFALAFDCQVISGMFAPTPTVVAIIGTYFDSQEITMKNPIVVGRYSYKAVDQSYKTVPVLMEGPSKSTVDSTPKKEKRKLHTYQYDDY